MDYEETYRHHYEGVMANIEARKSLRLRPSNSSAPATTRPELRLHHGVPHPEKAEGENLNGYDNGDLSDSVPSAFRRQSPHIPVIHRPGTMDGADTYRQNYERICNDALNRKWRSRSNSSVAASVVSAPAAARPEYRLQNALHSEQTGEYWQPNHYLRNRRPGSILGHDDDEVGSESESVAIDSISSAWTRPTTNFPTWPYPASSSSNADSTYRYPTTPPDALTPSAPYKFMPVATGGPFQQRHPDQQDAQKPLSELFIAEPESPCSDSNLPKQAATETLGLWDLLLSDRMCRAISKLSRFQLQRGSKIIVWMITLYLVYHNGHRLPVIGGVVSLVTWAATAIFSLCIQILLHALFGASGGDPNPMVCYSHGGPQVYPPSITTYRGVLAAHGWDIHYPWEGRPLIRSKISSSSSPSRFSDSPAPAAIVPIQARRDLIDDYESLLACMRTAIRRTEIDQAIAFAATQLQNELSESRRSLINASANLSSEFVAIANDAAAAMEALNFLWPKCQPGCLLLRLEFARFWECVKHSYGTQFAGRWRMAVCKQGSNVATANSDRCINNPWDNIVYLLERILSTWQRGSGQLKAIDYQLLNMIPRINNMHFSRELDFVAMLEEVAGSDTIDLKLKESIDDTQEGESVRQAQAYQHSQIKKIEDRITANHAVNSGRAALRVMAGHIRGLISAHCLQLCSAVSALSEFPLHDLSTDAKFFPIVHDIADAPTDPPLREVCANSDSSTSPQLILHATSESTSGSYYTGDKGALGLHWVVDARKLLSYARIAHQQHAWDAYSGIAAWKVDGREIIDALAEVEVLARVADLWVKTQWVVSG
ncbi:hypothetical protein F5B21DRAFT_521068 [Xylaria acuta]|nr:hypothetical protein F5B21DRAFT_521068 [Xylaria acuta]